MSDDYVTGMIESESNAHRAILKACNKVGIDVMHRFLDPIQILVTVTCDGRLAFYMERGEGEEEFVSRALQQSVAAGVHLIGSVRASLLADLMTWTDFTMADHESAIQQFAAARQAEVDQMSSALMDALGESDDD